MYCPGCGQQVGAETNFCPRCGFYFGVLKELIATGGAPIGSQDPVQKKQPSERQKGIRLGAKLLFLSIVLLPASIALGVLTDGPLPLLVPFTVFLTGVIWMLYARLFREPGAEVQARLVPAVGGPRRPAMLPASADSIKTGVASAITTGEIMRPGETMRPSVTEHTTNFLDPK
jgi:hypothetical protein